MGIELALTENPFRDGPLVNRGSSPQRWIAQLLARNMGGCRSNGDWNCPYAEISGKGYYLDELRLEMLMLKRHRLECLCLFKRDNKIARGVALSLPPLPVASRDEKAQSEKGEFMERKLFSVYEKSGHRELRHRGFRFIGQ